MIAGSIDAPKREKRLSLRVDVNERKMLEALAARDGLTVSDVVRLFARRAYAEAFRDVALGSPRGRKNPLVKESKR